MLRAMSSIKPRVFMSAPNCQEVRPSIPVILAAMALPPSLPRVATPIITAQIAQSRLGAGVRVVSAFHNVGAAKLKAGGAVDCDVLVFSDDRAARDTVIVLAEALGTRGIDGGPLANSAAAEALTSVLIGINRRYKIEGAGIRITGIPGSDPDA